MKFDELLLDPTVKSIRKTIWRNVEEKLLLPPLTSDGDRGVWCKLYGYDGNPEGKFTYTDVLVWHARDDADNWEVVSRY